MPKLILPKLILLSFDLEEFDIPEEYGQTISDDVKFEVSARGLESLLSLIERLEIKATFFVTANFARRYREKILAIAKHHEIASHGFYHSSFHLEDLEKSKVFLEDLIGARVLGFRMARLKTVSDRAIAQAGYTYNSSLNPTYLPGRYNHFFKPRTACYSRQVLNIPVSVTPFIRFPLFWLSFKNLPLPLYKLLSRLTLNWDGYLSLYFHPWEFTDITDFQMPTYVKRRSGTEMLKRLENYLVSLKKQGQFITYSAFQEEFHEKTRNYTPAKRLPF